MTELFDANLQIIASRWPALAQVLSTQDVSGLDATLTEGRTQTISINGIQLSSRHDRVAEVRLLLSTVPEDATGLTLFGSGMGDLPEFALERSALKSLTVVLMNPAIFCLLCHYCDYSKWLDDPKLELTSSHNAHLLPDHFIAMIADLKLCSDAMAPLRDNLLRELNRSHTNRKHLASDELLLSRFKANEAFLVSDPSAAKLKPGKSCEHVLVIGAGPSLEEDYSHLAQAQINGKAPLIIAVDTAMKGLVSHGIQPEIVVSIDKLIGAYHLPLEHSAGSALVYFPGLDTALLSQWQGPRYSALGTSASYDTLASQHALPRLFCGGSVVHPAVDLACRLGAKEITLLGCDFCFCDNKSHAFWHSHPQSDETGKDWSATVKQQVEAADHWVINGRGERVNTLLNLSIYLRALERFIAANTAVCFYRASQSGAMIEGTTWRPLAHD